IDLHARVVPAALDTDDHALAEARMRDALSDAKRDAPVESLRGPLLGRRQAAMVAIAGANASLCRSAPPPLPGAAPALAVRGRSRRLRARRQPLQKLLGKLVEESRAQAVACLAVEHARLRE